jgi:CyaY protein
MLSEADFDRLAEETLSALIEAIASTEDEGVDADLESGVLSIAFDDGTRFVVNSHRAARQIWMAAGASAWHFDWTGEAWIAKKNGDELWASVERETSRKLGRRFVLQGRG